MKTRTTVALQLCFLVCSASAVVTAVDGGDARAMNRRRLGKESTMKAVPEMVESETVESAKSSFFVSTGTAPFASNDLDGHFDVSKESELVQFVVQSIRVAIPNPNFASNDLELSQNFNTDGSFSPSTQPTLHKFNSHAANGKESVSFTGTVWHDVNDNGRRDDDEVGLSGYLVQVKACATEQTDNDDGLVDNDVLVAFALSAADGSYELIDFGPPGCYDIHLVRSDMTGGGLSQSFILESGGRVKLNAGIVLPNSSTTVHPTLEPTLMPSIFPTTNEPSASPLTSEPTMLPSFTPTTSKPKKPDTGNPTLMPSTFLITDVSSASFTSGEPTTISSSVDGEPVKEPTMSKPTSSPLSKPTTSARTRTPSSKPIVIPKSIPTVATKTPTTKLFITPSEPSSAPTTTPSLIPITKPTVTPTFSPTKMPSIGPTLTPTSITTSSITSHSTESNPIYVPTLVSTSSEPTIISSTTQVASQNLKPTAIMPITTTIPPTEKPTGMQSSIKTLNTNEPTKQPQSVYLSVLPDFIKVTVLETQGELSMDAKVDLGAAMDAFFGSKLTDYYNGDGEYFQSIDFILTNHSSIEKQIREEPIRYLRSVVKRRMEGVIGTEILCHGRIEFFGKPPSSNEITDVITFIGKKYNRELVSAIVNIGNAELSKVYIVSVEKNNGFEDPSIWTGTNPNEAQSLEHKATTTDLMAYAILWSAMLGTLTLLIFMFVNRRRADRARISTDRSALSDVDDINDDEGSVLSSVTDLNEYVHSAPDDGKPLHSDKWRRSSAAELNGRGTMTLQRDDNFVMPTSWLAALGSGKAPRCDSDSSSGDETQYSRGGLPQVSSTMLRELRIEKDELLRQSNETVDVARILRKSKSAEKEVISDKSQIWLSNMISVVSPRSNTERNSVPDPDSDSDSSADCRYC